MRKIVITGASSGIGLQLAKDYLQQGHQVFACGRRIEKLHQGLDHPNVKHLVFDTTNATQCEEVLGQLSPPDLVILNAGGCEYVDDGKALDAALFSRVIDTNVKGTVNCLAALLPRMKTGSQVAIVSSSVTLLPLTRAEAYGASKAALDYLARSLAVDLREHRIDVSLIRPGFVDTPLTRRNDFPMPGQISVNEASHCIRQGLEKRKSEINFPWLFIVTMRLLALLPGSWWQLIAANMRKSTA